MFLRKFDRKGNAKITITDSEIVKALKCCNGSFDTCSECPLDEQGIGCWKLEKLALDLINRLQAENERLKEEVKEHIKKSVAKRKYDRALIKAEAYKECIEKVMSKSLYNPSGMFYIVPEEWLKELVVE